MTFGKYLRWMICLSILLITMALQAQSPEMYFDKAEPLGLYCARFDPSISPAFRQIFESSPGHAAVQNVSFVVTNLSTKSIIGLAFKYRIIASDATETTYIFKTHSYLMFSLTPLMTPGERMLISPDSAISESLIRPGHGVAGTTPRQRTLSQFRLASRIYVGIDAVVFDDGEVVGTNELQLAQSMQHYKDAADVLERQIKSAEASHQDVHASLTLLQSTPRASTDPIGKHLSRLLHLLTTESDFQSAHNYIRKLRIQPDLFRKGGLPL